MRIVVVDDIAEFLRAARFLLEEGGHDPAGPARRGDEGPALEEDLPRVLSRLAAARSGGSRTGASWQRGVEPAHV
jgi:hypothetical protein